MKRQLCALLILALLLVQPLALAEEGLFSDVAGLYDFSSGAGAWDTELTILPDGSFSGSFHDTDMEDSALNGVHYDAICYCASFSGRLSPLEHASAQEMDSTVLELNVDPFEAYVDDGVRYEPVEPYGIAKGDRLCFFMAGADVNALPEGLLDWLRMKLAVESGCEFMPFLSMYNETAEAGFSGPSAEEAAQTPATGQSGGLFVETPEEGSAPDESPQEGLTFPLDAEVVNCKQSVSLRSEPSTKGALLSEVPLGELVQVYSNTAYPGGDHWFVDAAYNGLRGYICIEYLDILLPDQARAGRRDLERADGSITAADPGTDLLMRAGPGADYRVTGLLFGGEVLGYLGDARKDAKGTCWYRASYYGEECWISARYTVLTLSDGTRYTGSRGIF